jgi:hypothetical protein
MQNISTMVPRFACGPIGHHTGVRSKNPPRHVDDVEPFGTISEKATSHFSPGRRVMEVGRVATCWDCGKGGNSLPVDGSQGAGTGSKSGELAGRDNCAKDWPRRLAGRGQAPPYLNERPDRLLAIADREPRGGYPASANRIREASADWVSSGWLGSG